MIYGMKINEDLFSIYGMFDENGKCLYVGRTADPYTRELAHKKRFGEKCELRILTQTRSIKRAKKLERESIHVFTQNGQAKFNSLSVPVEKIKIRAVKIPLSLHRELFIAAIRKRKRLQTFVETILVYGLKHQSEIFS